jgi:hypothetical protein
MTKLQWILFAVLMVIMTVLMIVFWGSIFSGLMMFCMLLSVSTLLYNKFINVDRDNEFADSEDG